MRALINRNAYRHNLRAIEERCRPAEALAVIKADAYGHGMIEMARLAGSLSLAVAIPEEASLLLDAGVPNKIWVLEGAFSPDCLKLSARSEKIVWVVHQLAQLEMMSVHCESCYRVWLKLDTGMHRLGFQGDELEDGLALIKGSKNIALEGVMTHFASSEQDGEPSVDLQVRRFDTLLQKHNLSDLPQSLANSGAIINYPQTCRRVVRPGIASYGAMHNESLSLQPVMTLQSAVIALRKVAVGESVGYGGTWTADRASLIATIAGGYGDGYPRHAANGTPVIIKGARAPLVGRVSMDMLTVDVTDVPGVALGDAAEFWGEELSVEEVASYAGTISYELLTGVTSRVPRIYL